MIWVCMKAESQQNSSWLEGDGCEDRGSDGAEGCRTRGTESTFLPCFHRGQSIGENLLNVFLNFQISS